MKKTVLDKSLQYIDSWLQFSYTQNELPGYTVAIAHKNEVIFNKSYGFADVEKKIKLTPDHIFRIASQSKTFTATALMQLQESGKLRIDDRVTDYLPWLSDHTDKRWQNITLRQIMSHGAGIIRDGLAADYWQLERPFPDKEELRKKILECELVLENNIKLKYSNFGYSLLGLVIEAASGETYRDYVTNHIVKKLELSHTGPDYKKDIDSTLVVGYSGREVAKSRLPIDQIDTQAMSAATGFYSTSADLCAYYSAQIVGSKKLLDDESKKEMQRVQFHAYTPGSDSSVDYGLGLDIEWIGKRKVLGHSGGFPGQTSISMFDPKDELIIVVLANSLGAPVGGILRGVFGVIDYYQENTSTTKPKHELAKLEGRYMNLWGMTDIIVTGDKVAAVYPGSLQPLSQPEILERIDDTTFKVGETNSFLSEGELVRFELKNGKVLTVNYNGMTMWTEKDWNQKQLDRKQISLK